MTIQHTTKRKSNRKGKNIYQIFGSKAEEIKHKISKATRKAMNKHIELNSFLNTNNEEIRKILIGG